MPRATFDPADPKAIGRMVSIALLAQPLIALEDIQPAYGSGVYAIYYRGEHPLYASISGSETPIYVGKADPANHDASTAREQGAKLTARASGARRHNRHCGGLHRSIAGTFVVDPPA